MNQFRNILLMLFGFALSLGSNAQTIVTGSNLNIGNNNTLNSGYGNAIGTNHWLGGNHSLAVGSNDTIMNNSTNSIALGSVNRINGMISTAVGSSIGIEGNRAVGIGHDLKLTGLSGCIIIGSGIIGSWANPNMSLENNYSDCLMIGLHSTKPTLTVSPSPNDYPNGTTFNRTGKVAIGDIPVSDIAAKLHIRSDEYEDAGIFLQPTGKNGEVSFINMSDIDHQIMVKADGSMDITASNNDLNLSGANTNLSGNVLSLGYSGNRKFYVTTQGSPAIYSNAYRTSNGCFRYTEGSSYAFEFNNDGLLFRTAVNQEPRGIEITNWRDALLLKTNGAITLNGKVGINTENTTSAYALAVDGGLLSMGRFKVTSEDTIQIIAKDGIYNKPILLKGYVGINTDHVANGYALSVNGNIIAEKVMIKYSTEWPDYVFESEYKLMSMQDLRTFVTQNKHLPEVPSATEIENGLDVGQLQGVLLKKIEELTLYTLQLQEQVEQQQTEIEELKNKMK